jgi:hypothetical protein
MHGQSRFRSAVLVLVIAVVGVAGPAVQPADSAEAAGLRVEQVLWKPNGAGGGLIEVSYKLIAVTELPRHPSITYLLDEKTGNRLELQRVAMVPPTAMTADEAPLARFELNDREGRFWPGDQVAVVVAGLVQKNVTIEGEIPEGYRDIGTESGTTPEAEPVDPGEAKLEVVKLMVAGGGALLDLRYRLSGVSLVQADEHDSYILKPDTGEKFFVLGVARIGTLATKDPGATKTSFILIQNSERKIKVGDRVTVVISGAKQENVLVEDPVDG